MVAAGMTPAQVIVAATRNAADMLRLADLGTVAAGKSADFLVLDANPLDDITNTRRIASVYLRGTAVDRAALRARWTGRGVAVTSTSTTIERRAEAVVNQRLKTSSRKRSGSPFRASTPRAGRTLDRPTAVMKRMRMDEQRSINRRRFIECFSAAGLGSTLMPGALAAVAQDAATITIDMLQAAQTDRRRVVHADEQQRLLEKLNGARGYLAGFARLRAAGLGGTQPAIVFNPVPPGKTLPSERRPLRRQKIEVSRPGSDEELAFLPLTHLARLVETRQSHSHRAHETLSRAPEEIRSAASVRRQSDRGARASPGEPGRPGDCGGQVSRAAARHPMGTERSLRSPRRRRPRGACRRSRIASSTPTRRSTAG